MRLLSVPLLVLACASPAAAQGQPPVHLPAIEIGAGVSVEHSSAGAVASMSGNLTNILAITSEVTTSGDGVTLLAGGRVSTGFWYDGKPPMPGRFFAQVMAGRQHGQAATNGTIVQPGVGADVIVLPHSGISLHWSFDYKYVASAPPERSGVRLLVGIVIGPRT
jgi:hypothetical protein